MKHVAFDLDSTLGYFYVVNVLALFWSPEFLNTPWQTHHTGPRHISARLTAKLRQTRMLFYRYLLNEPALLAKILRPNLDEMILPLIERRHRGELGAVIMYSNSPVFVSLELAKYIIEHRYCAPNLFCCLADAFHPLRKVDHGGWPETNQYKEPLKTFAGAATLIKNGCQWCHAVSPQDVIFIDDRLVKHQIQDAVPAGLTYIQPIAYVSRFTAGQKQRLFMLALQAMNSSALLQDSEYLDSPFCHRRIGTMHGTRILINGFQDLFQHVWDAMEEINDDARAVWPEKGKIRAALEKALSDGKYKR